MHLAGLLAADARLAARVRRLPHDPLQPFPLCTAKIKLTWRCNFRCRMCGVWQRPQQAPQGCELPAPLVLQTLDRLRELGLLKVHFSGGEVFLHPGIRAIIARACATGSRST